MPSYYFHLAFELVSSSSGLPRGFEDADRYRPPASFDIFKARLPSHPLPQASSSNTDRPTAQVTESQVEGESHAVASTRSTQGEARSEGPSGPIHPSSGLDIGTHQHTATGKEKVPLDERMNNLSIESIDMVSVEARKTDRSRGKSANTISDGFDTGADAFTAKARFVPSDLQNTELGCGIVHLYRDALETPGLYDDSAGGSPSRGSAAPVSRSSDDSTSSNCGGKECTTLCILAVPSYLTPSDFLGLVGERTRDQVSHFRMVRTERSNRYMVLMKFRSPRRARDWRKEWNGKTFSSMEPETFHVVFVKSIRFETSGSSHSPSTFPDISDNPLCPPNGSKHGTLAALAATSAASKSAAVAPASTLSAKPVAPPTPSLVELPTCPVCLERMDETTGLLTIQCQHVFHCTCLQKWRGSGCPVCRYTGGEGPNVYHHSDDVRGLEQAEKLCSTCGTESNLWICLVCGNVGCGRYDEAHAFSHYEDTSHCYAMDVETQRVWDYGGDGYVHRLLQNKSDGMLVELPSALKRSAGVEEEASSNPSEETVPRQKLDNIGLEYTHLLTSQLESQRLYFETKIAQAADKASKAAQSAEAAAITAREASQGLARLQSSHDELVQDVIPGLERDRDRASRKSEKASETTRKMEREWKEEKAMNVNLLERVQCLQKEVARLKAENGDLQEQNRDLTFFISGQQKLEGLGEEVQEGTVMVGAAPGTGKGKKGKGKGKR
ncbi:MAG: hypothetical protein M1817_003048 [Caeruleum heppii]|nr:MAG: hypothetical protein M1817_003048 [Caeruleum heppii]